MENRYIDVIGNEVKIGDTVAYVAQHGIKLLFMVAILKDFDSNGKPIFSYYDPVTKHWRIHRPHQSKQHIKVHVPLGITQQEAQERAFTKAKQREAEKFRRKHVKQGSVSLVEKFWQELKNG